MFCGQAARRGPGAPASCGAASSGVAAPTGVGKSWLACALGHTACRDDRTVLYQRAPKLFAELAVAALKRSVRKTCVFRHRAIPASDPTSTVEPGTIR
ncbi:ATP-binding protein [Acidiphilium multivorum]|uniref:ATP-binding protein n=1 Tax=Acidiphilium multivorum TaxID=62140 RepID=UPI0038D0E2A3